MKRYIFVTTIIFVSVRADEWDYVHISRSEDSLRECLEKNPLWETFGFYMNTSLRKDTASSLAGQLDSRSSKQTYVKYLVSKLTERLTDYESIKSSRYEVFKMLLKHAILKIIVQCSDKKKTLNTFVDLSSNYHELPHYIGYPRIEELLNLILVDQFEYLANKSMNSPNTIRTTSVPEMLNTDNGRFLFRKYCEKALNLLKNIKHKSYFDYSTQLRRIWQMKSTDFFDGRDQKHPYPKYVFSMNYEEPFTRDDPNVFIRRSIVGMKIRDPPALPSQIESVMNILSVYDGIDNFPDIELYKTLRIRHSDYYLSIHLIRFHQRLFLYIKMLEKEFDDQRDTRYGFTHDYGLSEKLLALVSNDSVYRDFLFETVTNDLNMNYDGTAAQPLDRLREEFLILNLWSSLTRTAEEQSELYSWEEDNSPKKEKQSTSTSKSTIMDIKMEICSRWRPTGLSEEDKKLINFKISKLTTADPDIYCQQWWDGINKEIPSAVSTTPMQLNFTKEIESVPTTTVLSTSTISTTRSQVQESKNKKPETKNCSSANGDQQSKSKSCENIEENSKPFFDSPIAVISEGSVKGGNANQPLFPVKKKSAWDYFRDIFLGIYGAPSIREGSYPR